MVRFIDTMEERVSRLVAKAEDAVRGAEILAKARVVEAFDEAISGMETALIVEGLALDKACDEALMVIKDRLSAMKDEMGGVK